MVNSIHLTSLNIQNTTRIEHEIPMVFIKMFVTLSTKNVESNAFNMDWMKMQSKSKTSEIIHNVNVSFIPIKFNRMSAPELPKCKCQGNSQLLQGWEGSAILSHGSLVRFGCLAFVFSTIDEIKDD